MKKLFLCFPALLLLAVSCEKEPVFTSLVKETVSGSRAAATKATISDADASFAWTEGDDVAVHISNGKYVYTSDEGASAAHITDVIHADDASFTVAYEAGNSRDAFAVFPSTIVAKDAANYGQDGHALDVTLPASYALAQLSGEVSPCPMIAANKPGEGWDFYQLCSLLRLTVDNIPSTAKRLEIDFNGKKVSGAFSIAANVTPGTSEIATEDDAANDCITVTKDGSDVTLGATSLVLNIPLPTGVYEKISVVAYDALTDGNALLAGSVAFAYTAQSTYATKRTSTLGPLSSIFNFTFKHGATTLTNVRFARVFSVKNKLHNGTTTYGPFTASALASTDPDLPATFNATLLFDKVSGDQLAFQVVTMDGKVYSGSVDAPSEGYNYGDTYDVTANVNLYTFTVASGKKVYFSPGDLGVDNGVYSFTEPFTTWGHGDTKNANNAASAPAKRVWFDFYFESGLATGSVYGITNWRIPRRAGSTVASYEWNYLIASRTMNSGVNSYYKVTIPGYEYCLLLPPDETQSTDIGEDLTSGNVTDYAKYLSKGFVLLFNTNRGMFGSNKFSWGSSTSAAAKQGWYWTVYNNSNRFYFTWPDAGPKVDWGSNRMRNHIRYVRDVE